VQQLIRSFEGSDHPSVTEALWSVLRAIRQSREAYWLLADLCAVLRSIKHRPVRMIARIKDAIESGTSPLLECGKLDEVLAAACRLLPDVESKSFRKQIARRALSQE
jgi:hypothetical protein